MQHDHRRGLITGWSLVLTLLVFSVRPACAAELTQRDWMVALVDTLGWAYGLPDEPQDPDYINILSGNRTLRLEAEDIYASGEDNVSFMAFRNFGAFSGRGWLQGSREATEVHLRFTLPVGGNYQLSANLRQTGHQFRMGETRVMADAGPDFTEVPIGSFEFQAGPQVITVTLPPNGSIDALNLTAPNLPAIAPLQGWQPDQPLTWEVIQVTLLQLFELAAFFPASEDPVLIEAEPFAQADAPAVSTPHLGQTSGEKWLRTGPRPATLSIPFTLPERGFYDLSLRVMGAPVKIIIGDHQEITFSAQPFLSDFVFKGLSFQNAESNIRITLPANGGLDRFILTRRKVDPTAAAILLGQAQGDQPTVNDLDTLTAKLAAFGVNR